MLCVVVCNVVCVVCCGLLLVYVVRCLLRLRVTVGVAGVVRCALCVVVMRCCASLSDVAIGVVACWC